MVAVAFPLVGLGLVVGLKLLADLGGRWFWYALGFLCWFGFVYHLLYSDDFDCVH